MPNIIIIHLLHFFSPTRSYQEQKLDLEQGKPSELIPLADKNHICCFGCFHTKEQIFGVWGQTSCHNCCFERVHNPAWRDPWRRRLWSESGLTIHEWVNHPVGQPSNSGSTIRRCGVSQGLHCLRFALVLMQTLCTSCHCQEVPAPCRPPPSEPRMGFLQSRSSPPLNNWSTMVNDQFSHSQPSQ